MNGNNTTLRVFVGWDSREDISFQACKQSLLTAAKYPNNLEIYPLKLDELRKKGVYTREEDKLGSTEFTFSRFLVPALCDTKDAWSKVPPTFPKKYGCTPSKLLEAVLLPPVNCSEAKLAPVESKGIGPASNVTVNV